MSVQTTYGFATGRGIAGGIYDMDHYPVDSRFNEEPNGKLRFGVGVVPGSLPGSNIILPTEASTAADFEGVIVNGFDRQQDLEGKLTILNNQNVGVMRRGRIWVRVAEDAAPAYGDALHLVVEGDEAGFFATDGGLEIPGRFIGAASGGVAPAELYGITATGEAAEAAAAPAAASAGGTDSGNQTNGQA